MGSGLMVVMVLNWAVNCLLLLGTQRLSGHMPEVLRVVFAAALGGLYSGVCLLQSGSFFRSPAWLGMQLAILSIIAFGLSRSAFRKGLLFSLLRMAVDGITAGLGSKGIWSVAAAAGLVCLLAAIVFGSRAGKGRYVPVQIVSGDQRVQLTALEDTGNCLRDPVTGASVLIVGAQAARLLTGLAREQLRTPLEAMGSIPGLRLIPYRTVGTGAGLLLAMRFPDVRIGSWQGSALVAFAPEGLEMEHPYQALTGGSL